MTYKILQGDAVEVMKTLPIGSVDMCVTSPRQIHQKEIEMNQS